MSKAMLQQSGCQIGADPEFFFRGPNNEVVGSERVISDKGLDLLGEPMQYYKTDKTGRYERDKAGNYIPDGPPRRGVSRTAIFVRDGIQAEINPGAYSCREGFASTIGQAFMQLKEHLKNSPGIKICLDPFVELKPEEMEGLSERSRMLGCTPSLNYYNADAKVGIDPLTYMKRSAGGHVHLGFSSSSTLMNKRSRIVPLLDILVGNTCVLIDRDPNAAERRKVYGRAGEHRLPAHGLEYRTLSNFWLQSYPLFSLVMGLSRLAVDVIGTYTTRPAWSKATGYTQDQWDQFYPVSNYWNAEEELLGLFGVKVRGPKDPIDPTYLLDVQEAINNNDADLAWQNWKLVRKFLEDHMGKAGNSGNRGLDAGSSLDNFEFFARMVQADGGKFTRFFPGDPVDNWITRSHVSNNHRGAETFFSTTLTPMRQAWEAEQKMKAKVVEAPVIAEPVVEKPKRVIARGAGGRFVKKAA